MHRHRTARPSPPNFAAVLALVVVAATAGCEPGSQPEQGPGPVIGIEPDLSIGAVEGADMRIPRADEQSLRYEYPETKAAYKSIVVADDGTFWVRLSPASVEYPIPARAGATSTSSPGTYWGDRLGATFEVFSGLGDHLGRAELPRDLWSDPDLPYSVRPVITGNHLWAVTLDSLNVQYVTRYRIVRADRDAAAEY